jgi:hypothetical protein
MKTIKYNKKSIHLGCFSTQEEAAAARDKKAAELHGKFFVPSLKVK